ncbi:hypothetical protein B0H34DRAFT_353127 [Crassisporium funariophilum]|nr:hypothetical protein B0H34DRAFT_353127 [Crassisporium funariophilum]
MKTPFATSLMPYLKCCQAKNFQKGRVITTNKMIDCMQSLRCIPKTIHILALYAIKLKFTGQQNAIRQIHVWWYGRDDTNWRMGFQASFAVLSTHDAVELSPQGPVTMYTVKGHSNPERHQSMTENQHALHVYDFCQCFAIGQPRKTEVPVDGCAYAVQRNGQQQ